MWNIGSGSRVLVSMDLARLTGRPGEMDREAAWMARCVGRGEWAPLADADLTDLGARLESKTFTRGGLLFPQGAPPDGVWIVRSGRVELSHREGRRRMVLRYLRPGDVDGDIGQILGLPRPYAGRAVDEVRALFLSSANFESLIATHPALARRWLSSVAARLMFSQQRVLQLSSGDLHRQVAMLLLDESDGGVVELPQQSLAALLGATRSAVNRVLRDFERSQVVTLGYGRVEIIDRVRLGGIAGGS